MSPFFKGTGKKNSWLLLSLSLLLDSGNYTFLITMATKYLTKLYTVILW